MLISPDNKFRQVLQLIITESEMVDLWRVLAKYDEFQLPLPKVAKELRNELWYMIEEVRDFNTYQKEE